MIDDGVLFADLRSALTDRMGVLHTAETSATQRDRVEWARAGKPVPGPIPYRVAGEKTIGRLAHTFKLTVYGASDIEVCQRVSELWGHVDELVGPPQGCAVPGHDGYELKPGDVGMAGGDGAAAGYSCDVTLTLYQRVASQIRPTAPITKINIFATAEATATADEASLFGESS